MALLARPRDRARHAARTPLLQQLGFRRRPAALQESLRFHQPALPAPVSPSGEEHARGVVGSLTAGVRQIAGVDWYPLAWQYQDGAATGHVDAKLPSEIAREVFAAYALVLSGVTLTEEMGGRVWLRASRSVDGVVVTVRADITPPPLATAIPAVPEPASTPEQSQLPCERLAHCALDDTQVFDAITDDTPVPAELVSASDDLPVEPGPNTHSDEQNPASTADDTSSTPLPQGTEDTEEEDTPTDG